MKHLTLLSALLLGLASAGGAQPALTPASTPLSARATLLDSSGQARGAANFTQVGSGMRVEVSVSGLTPGQHGMHLHEMGSCAPGKDPATGQVVAFGSAGGHFDPGMSMNHDSPTADDKLGHGGDLPMLSVGADGVGKAVFTTQKSSLTGKNGVLNRTLVVHAQPDDYASEPSGMSGARERCGLIVRDNLTTRDYLLPDTRDFPEGVTYSAARGLLYTGSAANGNIYSVNVQTGAVKLFSRGGALGRQAALGMKLDSRGQLWVAGGATGAVAVLSPEGAPVATIMTPPSPNPYLNDLVVISSGVYITDSSRPVLWHVSPEALNLGKVQAEPWLDLSQTPIKYGPGINLNGLAATPDGRYLLSVQLNTGELWRIDLKTKAVKKVMDGLTRGDGLLLEGHTLYVARNAEQVVAKVTLSADYGSGQLVAEEPLTGLRFPATLTSVGGDLVVTQSQLNKLQGGVVETPFKLTRFKKF